MTANPSHLLVLCPLLMLTARHASAAEPLQVQKTDSAYEIRAGKELVAAYQFGKTVAKPYIYPLNAPGGIPVTRGWPMVKGTPGETTDHVHQKSAWFCHGDVIPEGVTLKTRSADKKVEGVDFWSEGAGHGVIACVEAGEPKVVSATHIVLPTKNEWRTPDGEKILDEARTLHVHTLDRGYLIVLEIDLHASVCAITFGDTKEGSMGVRVSDEIRLANKAGTGRIATSDGKRIEMNVKGNLPIWGQPADWHDYFGTIGGKEAGISLFDDSRNNPRSCWHTRDYGLLAANPFGREKSQFPAMKGKTERANIPPNGHLKLRYGIYAHTGDTNAGNVAQAYGIFVK